MSFWICYDDKDEHPWKVLPPELARQDDRCREYATDLRANLVVARLERLWSIWLQAWLLSRLPQNESFTEEFVEALMDKIATEHKALRIMQNIRQLARRSGLAPNDVLTITYDADGDRLFGAGPKIAWLPIEGSQWRPKDPRRVNSFQVKETFDTYVVGRDGRRVQIKRLLRRYEPVT